MATLKKIQLNTSTGGIVGYDGAIWPSAKLLLPTAQTLNSTEKTQAQTNLGILPTGFSDLTSTRQTETLFQNNTTAFRIVWTGGNSFAPSLNLTALMGPTSSLGMSRTIRPASGTPNSIDLTVPPNWYYKISVTVSGTPQAATNMSYWFEST